MSRGGPALTVIFINRRFFHSSPNILKDGHNTCGNKSARDAATYRLLEPARVVPVRLASVNC
jgi:hypothetical protein